MIKFVQGNLLEDGAEALVNTVNTVGVMGKGIALMFRERFQDNYRRYALACKAGDVKVGKVFVTEPNELAGPRWIVNFPTKRDWRHPSRLEWISDGLEDLKRFLIENEVKSVAIPPLGAGNGGLDWLTQVRPTIESKLGDLNIVIAVYEPTATYQNVSKRSGVERLTPARALIAELVRRYWVLGMECSLLEIQKLAWFLQRAITSQPGAENPLRLNFAANKFGPYAHNLTKLLDGLDGSYLRSEKRIADAGPLDVIWFEDSRKDQVHAYLTSEAKPFVPALDETKALIDGFESPFGMELLATVDWLVHEENVSPNTDAVLAGLKRWRHDGGASRKVKLFDERAVSIALERLASRKLETRSRITAET